jgi:hypothetical protein
MNDIPVAQVITFLLLLIISTTLLYLLVSRYTQNRVVRFLVVPGIISILLNIIINAISGDFPSFIFLVGGLAMGIFVYAMPICLVVAAITKCLQKHKANKVLQSTR